MVDTLNYFSFKPVIHDWYNKGRSMSYPICGMVYMKDPLLLVAHVGAAAGFLSNLIGSLLSVRHHITVNKMC